MAKNISRRRTAPFDCTGTLQSPWAVANYLLLIDALQ